jgi:nicotinamidase/pyrazinamidase
MKLSTASALVLVDIQRDFLPGGALAVPRGDEVIAPANRLAQGFGSAGLPVVATRDWHPSDHMSFKDRGGPWPPHAIQNTTGAEFAKELALPGDAWIVDKDTDPEKSTYSGFQDTDLAERLREAGVQTLLVCGLSTDYCVKQTALDAIKEGFEVVLVADACRGVNVHASDSPRAVEEMLRAGARIASSGAVHDALEAYTAAG